MKDDISLSELLLLIGQFFKRNVAIILGLTAAGLILSLTYAWQKPRIYSSSMVLCSKMVDADRFVNILSPLEGQISSGSYEIVSKQMGLSTEDVRKIKKFKIEAIPNVDRKFVEDYPYFILSNCIEITCEVEDPNMFPKISDHLVNKLGNHEIIATLYSQKKKSLAMKVKYIQDDIEFLRDARKQLYTKANEGSQSGNLNIEDSETDLLNAYQDLANNQNELDLLQPFYTFRNFEDHSKGSKNYSKYGSLGGVLFLILGIAIGIYKEI